MIIKRGCLLGAAFSLLILRMLVGQDLEVWPKSVKLVE